MRSLHVGKPAFGWGRGAADWDLDEAWTGRGEGVGWSLVIAVEVLVVVGTARDMARGTGRGLGDWIKTMISYTNI